MSDHLSPLNELRFLDKIKFSENPSFTCKSEVSETEVAFSISISYNFFKQLKEAVDTQSFSHVSILNSQVEFVQFIDCERLNSRFRNLSYKVLSELKSCKGLKRMNLLLKQKHVTNFKPEVINVRHQQLELSQLNEEKIDLERRCRELYGTISSGEQLGKIISDQNLDIHTLEQKNEYLHCYIKQLEAKLPSKVDKAKDIDTLKPNTRLRTLKTLTTEAQKALWFMDTFGLTLKSLQVTSKDGKRHSLKFEGNELSTEATAYDSVSPEDKERIRKLVYLMDRFCISDAAYHELTVFNDEMPRTYLLVQCKNDLNKLFDIERLPGNVPGAMVNIESEVEKLLHRHVNQHPDVKDVKIKFSGDGAKVSRISNFVIFSLSNVTFNEAMSFHEQQTFAIVECSESYESLKKCCGPISQ